MSVYTTPSRSTPLSASGIARPFTFHSARLACVIIAAILCLAVGLVTRHAQLGAVAAGAMLFIGLVFPWLAVRCLTASFPPGVTRMRVSDSASLDLSLTSVFPLPLASVDVHLPPGFQASSVPLGPISPGSSAHTLILTPLTRGHYHCHLLRIGTSAPFGLLLASKPIQSNATLIVWPIALPVSPAVLEGASHTVASFDSAQSRVNQDAEMIGVRPYRRGDPIRTVHWQQTARHDRLIVRERGGGQINRTATFTLDSRPSSYANAHAFERAVSLTAGLVQAALQEGLTVKLHTHPTGLTVAPDLTSLPALLDALAAASLHPSNPSVSPPPSPPPTPHASTGLFITTSIGAASPLSSPPSSSPSSSPSISNSSLSSAPLRTFITDAAPHHAAPAGGDA